MGIVGSIIGKIKEARNKRNERIDAVRRVETAIKSKGIKGDNEIVNKEAKLLSEKTGVGYADALAYQEHKERGRRQKEKVEGMVKSIVRAGQQSAMNIEKSGFLGGGKGRKGGSSIFKPGFGGGGGGGGDSIFKSNSIFGSDSTSKHRKKKKQHNKKKSNKKSNKQSIIINLK